jgi:hypothetical protein
VSGVPGVTGVTGVTGLYLGVTLVVEDWRVLVDVLSGGGIAADLGGGSESHGSLVDLRLSLRNG